MRKYIKCDFIRVFRDYKIYLASIIISIIMNMSVDGNRSDFKSTLAEFQSIATSKYMMIIFVVCAAVYACCLVDDLETQYIRYQIVRGKMSDYVISKSLTVFLSSVFTVVFGVILFVAFNSFFKPMTEPDAFEQVYVQYTCFFNERLILIWFVVWGIRFGILAGILSLAAMLTSLFITNKMFVLAMPALIYELMLEIATELGKFDISIFNLAWYRTDYSCNDVWERIRGIIFSVICFAVITELIIYKLKRRM